MHHLREALQNIQLLKEKDFLLVFLRFNSPLSPPRPAGVCRLVKCRLLSSVNHLRKTPHTSLTPVCRASLVTFFFFFLP